MAKRKSLAKSPFNELQKSYGLESPDQIKMNIIWKHIKAITLAVHGATHENRRNIEHYQKQWEIAEKEQNKKGAG
jgi:ABC-type iron transport system FetAB ATPase subunit